MNDIISQWYQQTFLDVLSRRETLPHALLLSGVSGIGKSHFAILLAKALLCQRPAGGQLYCGSCQSCQLHTAGTHPDFYCLEREGYETYRPQSEKPSKEIKIDQVRQLSRALSHTSQLGGLKVAIIDPADCMNRNAANSLLKTLEEPASETILLLVTASVSALLPTIRSRCQRLLIKPPPREQVLDWLQSQYPEQNAHALLAAAEDAPLTAAVFAAGEALSQRQALFQAFHQVGMGRQDPVMMAAKSARELSTQTFRWLLTWVQDLIYLNSTGGQSGLTNLDLQKDLQALSKRIDLQDLFGFYDKVQQAHNLLRSSANIQMLFESLMLDWSAKTRC